MDYRETYKLWKSDPYFDEADRNELASLTDEKEIAYRQLCREHPERAVFIPGVEETLDELKKYSDQLLK